MAEEPAVSTQPAAEETSLLSSVQGWLASLWNNFQQQLGLAQPEPLADVAPQPLYGSNAPADTLIEIKPEYIGAGEAQVITAQPEQAVSADMVQQMLQTSQKVSLNQPEQAPELDINIPNAEQFAGQRVDVIFGVQMLNGREQQMMWIRDDLGNNNLYGMNGDAVSLEALAGKDVSLKVLDDKVGPISVTGTHELASLQNTAGDAFNITDGGPQPQQAAQTHVPPAHSDYPNRAYEREAPYALPDTLPPPDLKMQVLKATDNHMVEIHITRDPNGALVAHVQDGLNPNDTKSGILNVTRDERGIEHAGIDLSQLGSKVSVTVTADQDVDDGHTKIHVTGGKYHTGVNFVGLNSDSGKYYVGSKLNTLADPGSVFAVADHNHASEADLESASRQHQEFVSHREIGRLARLQDKEAKEVERLERQMARLEEAHDRLESAHTRMTGKLDSLDPQLRSQLAAAGVSDLGRSLAQYGHNMGTSNETSPIVTTQSNGQGQQRQAGPDVPTI